MIDHLELRYKGHRITASASTGSTNSRFVGTWTVAADGDDNGDGDWESNGGTPITSFASHNEAIGAAVASARRSVMDRLRHRWLSHARMLADPALRAS